MYFCPVQFHTVNLCVLPHVITARAKGHTTRQCISVRAAWRRPHRTFFTFYNDVTTSWTQGSFTDPSSWYGTEHQTGRFRGNHCIWPYKFSVRRLSLEGRRETVCALSIITRVHINSIYNIHRLEVWSSPCRINDKQTSWASSEFICLGLGAGRAALGWVTVDCITNTRLNGHRWAFTTVHTTDVVFRV